VSRGGDKLAGALDRFGLDPTGVRALDVGASTGGFTDCLLQRGAAMVVAVDVGHDQLHERLRADPGSTAASGSTCGSCTPATWVRRSPGGRRLSFISLRTVLDNLVELGAPGADLVLLVKPQFEAGRREASRGRGVIREPAVWRRVLEDVLDALDGRGAAIMDAMVSPITGTGGNVEFLVHARTRPGAARRPRRPRPVVDDAVARAGR
jgi:23S rRNA (cytidine1920-2'-O)/16S rRNA (cytidine1409-2'-O)-methyltransferase